MTKAIVPPLLAIVMSGCASTTAYYPPMQMIDGKWYTPKAFQTYGDSIGATEINVTPSGVRYAASGGNMNSPTTAIVVGEIGRTARFGISWGFMYGILKSLFGAGESAYIASINKPAAVVAKPAPLPAVGSTIPAQTSAVVTPVP